MIDWHMHLHNITVEVAAANLAQNEIDALEHFRAVAEHARMAIEELEAALEVKAVREFGSRL